MAKADEYKKRFEEVAIKMRGRDIIPDILLISEFLT